MKKLIFIMIIAVMAVVVISPTILKHSSGIKPQASASITTITIKNYDFHPMNLRVKKGTTVTWINQDIAKHTISSDTSNLFTSGLIEQNGTFKHTFTSVGKYSYHCDPHPYMKATIEVY